MKRSSKIKKNKNFHVGLDVIRGNGYQKNYF